MYESAECASQWSYSFFEAKANIDTRCMIQWNLRPLVIFMSDCRDCEKGFILNHLVCNSFAEFLNLLPDVT